MVSPALLQGWRAVGHDLSTPWSTTLARLGALSLALAYLVLVVRALLLRHRYQARGVLSASDLEGLRAELAAAEKRTTGELLVVVLERSDRHPGASWLAAFVSGLLGAALLAGVLPWERPLAILLAQLALGALGYLLARALPGFQRVFLSEARARELAEEQAFQEFYRHGLYRTEGRTGVLLFVSLLEQRAIVLADEGIAAKVEPQQWFQTNDALLAGIRAGSLRDGLTAGIRRAGSLLAEQFPLQGEEHDELPDRVIVRRE